MIFQGPPGFQGKFLGPHPSVQAQGAEVLPPAGQRIFHRSVSQVLQTSVELLAALGKELAQNSLGLGRKSEKGFPSLQMDEPGMDLGNRVETMGRDRPFSNPIVGTEQADRDGAAVSGIGPGCEPFRRFPLEEKGHGAGQGAIEKGIQPGSGNGVG
jgi:hypothetical protein